MVNGVNCLRPIDLLFAMSLDVELHSTLYLGIPSFENFYLLTVFDAKRFRNERYFCYDCFYLPFCHISTL